MHLSNWRWVILASILPLLALGSTVVGFKNALEHSQDFQWQPSRILFSGQAPAQLYLDHLRGVIPEYPIMLEQYPLYPPSGLVFLWPLAALPWPFAKLAWAVLNLGFTLGIVLLLGRLYLRSFGFVDAVMLSSLFFMSTPARNTIGNGQHGLFALFFFLLALAAYRSGRSKLAAIALGVSWFKYTLTFPLSIVFLHKQRIQVVIGAALIHAALTAGLAVWTGCDPVDLIFDPLKVTRYVMGPGTVDVFTLLGRVGFANPLLPAAVSATTLLAAAYVALRFGRGDELLTLSLLSLVSCISLKHLPYDLIILVLPLAYLARTVAEPKERATPFSYRLVPVLFATAIITSWYVLRIADAAASLLPGTVTFGVRSLLMGCVIVTAYAGLGASAVQVIHHRQERAGR